MVWTSLSSIFRLLSTARGPMPQWAVHSHFRRALEEGRISYAGNPESIRESLHVEDAARASVLALGMTFAMRVSFSPGINPCECWIS